MFYEIKRGRENDENTLSVFEDGTLRFKMELKYSLVFATITHIWLYVLEQTPTHTVSTEVNLEKGMARSYTLNGNATENITEWSYSVQGDSWELHS